MTDKILNALAEKFPLTALDIGDKAALKANGMKFEIKAFSAEGLGRVSVMRAKGFFGLMKMDTVIINPTEIDLPLYSYDRIFAAGNDVLIVELYDTLLSEFSQEKMQNVKDRYATLAERDPGEHWYDSIKLPSSISKKGNKKQTTTLDDFALEHFAAYLESEALPVTDVNAKLEKASVYVNGLLEKGGPSTDVFKKSLGEAETEDLFKNVLFGIV